MGQLVGAERGGIIEIDLSGESSFVQGLDETIGQVFEVFLKIELPMGNETGMVIQEGKEKTFSHLRVNDHPRAMHTVRLPDVIGEFRFIPSEIGLEPLGFIEPQSLEEPVKTLNRGVKVGRKKLSFPGHPKNHGQGSSLEFCF